MAKDDSQSPISSHQGSLNISSERRATYLSRRKQDLEQLKVALEKSDMEPVRAIAHRIKGSARLFGFESLEKLMIRIETICDSEETPTLEREVVEFETILAQADNAPISSST